MIRQEFSIRETKWFVRFFYEVSASDRKEVLAFLRNAGCHGEGFRRSDRVMRRNAGSFGITYSNARERESIVVISTTDTPDEFYESFEREKFHLFKQLCTISGINPVGVRGECLYDEIGRFPLSITVPLIRGTKKAR